MNWKTDENNSFQENLETEIGTLTLEEIGSSDRGSHRFTVMPTRGYHNRILDLIPLYFFDKEVAKTEIEQWLKKALELGTCTLKSSMPPVTYILHGKHCMITLGKFQYYAIELSGYFFNVVIPIELGSVLPVDVNDGIPRLFVNKDAVFSEAEAWLNRRNQKAEYSKWEQV